METIPLHVLSNHLTSIRPNVDVVARLMCVSKEWHHELEPLLIPTAIAELRETCPEYISILEDKTDCNLNTVLKSCMVSIPSLIQVMKSMKALKTRTKGQRFRHLLDPMLDGSLLIQDDNITEEKLVATLVILFTFVAFTYLHYGVDFLFWPMYTTYDFLHHMYVKNKHFDILTTWLFRYCILMNIQELRTYPYRKHMGDVRGYSFLRMTQCLEYAMFSYLV